MSKLIKWLVYLFSKGMAVKFSAVAAVYAVVAVIVPLAVKFLSGFIDSSNLSNAFSALPPGVWYFLDLFRLDFGLPIVIAAFVARFLIRRLPVIG